MPAVTHRRLTEPLETVTLVFSFLLLIGLVFLLADVATGSGVITSGGRVCVTQPNAGPQTWGVRQRFYLPRAGASVGVSGSFQACAAHASAAERAWYALTSFPGLLVWAGLLLLLWRLLRAVRRAGPYTTAVASALRILGWFVIAAPMAAAAVQGYAQDRLLTMLMRPDVGVGDVFISPLHALVPVPLLAGAALLTFARVIGRGIAMDEELRATV